VDVFTRNIYSEIIEDSLNYCIEHKGLTVYGYVIMSNHIHLLVQSKKNNLSDIIRDFKKFTSQRIIASINSNEKESRKRWMLWLFTKEKATDTTPASYRFWQPDNHAEECFSLPFMWQKLNYIHNNPIRAGIVDKAEEYISSSAADYFYGIQKGRVKIERIDPLVVTV
jgi:REP element-mobilizing transposase RayT